MLFPRLSLPAVRIPTALPRATDKPSSAQDALPAIDVTPVQEIGRKEGKSFEEYVQEEAPKFEHDARFSKGLVRYKDLKNHIRKMENGQYGSSFTNLSTQYVNDECAICLDVLGPASDVITTTCKHKFHTFCLIQSLGDGLCASCPLCRNGVENIVPTGIEGASMKLVAKLRINIDQAQWSHKQIYDEIHKKAQTCLHDINTVARSHSLQLNSAKRKKQLELRVRELKEKIDLLEHFDRVNVMGFTKICDKVGKKFSTILGETLQDKYVNEQGYYKDFAAPPEGLGLQDALRKELDAGAGSLKRSSWRIPMLFKRSKSDGALHAPTAERVEDLESFVSLATP